MKIAVAGTGYAGLSITTLLSPHHQVIVKCYDSSLYVVKDKVYTRYLFRREIIEN